MFLVRGWQFVRHGLFPSRCVVCKYPGSCLCSDHAFFKPCPLIPWNGFFVDHVYAATRYQNEQVERVVEIFKYKGQKDLALPMAQSMAQILFRASIPENVVLVPLPLHWKRRFWRGFNQAFLLAHELASFTGSSVDTSLKRKKKTKQQAKLLKPDRLKNVEDAFVWKGESLAGKTVLLVDDVCASGATLEAAGCALKKAEAARVLGVVFARS